MEVARYVGKDAKGGPVFDIVMSVPDPLPIDIPPTQRMLDGVAEAFGDLGELTSFQAHALLSARDYARQCSDRLFPRSAADHRKLLVTMVAAFILADDDRTADVLAWSDRRFNAQPDGSAIGRTKRFREVETWLAGVVSAARAAGATFAG